MPISQAEQVKRENFEETYHQGQSAVLRSIERAVCGCEFGGTSWMTRTEADQLPHLLHLKAGVQLLDIGAGSGWPGLHVANNSGCNITLVDLPITGLKIAAERAIEDRLPGTCWTVLASATDLPFGDASFDAISHSDVLCCLIDKRGVLDACRVVIRPQGRLAFSVIYLAPGLTGADHERAVASAPDFADSETSYLDLLGETGWQILEEQDLSGNMADTCARQLSADEAERDELTIMLGEAEYEERVEHWRNELAAIKDGLIRRSLFVAIPK